MVWGFQGRAWCRDALWKDALKANPPGVAHEGAAGPNG